jgi:cell division septation protein DedD
MPNRQPPPAREGETDDDILSLSQEELVTAHAPATHPQVLDDLFTPPAFLLARDVQREVKDLALHAPAQAPAPPAAPIRPAEPTYQQAPAEFADKSAPVEPTVKPAPVEARIVSLPKPPGEGKPASDAGPVNEVGPVCETSPEAVPGSGPAGARQVRESRAAETVETDAAGRIADRPEPARAVPPAPQLDNYAVGLRLLRISPAWLVLSSIGFFLLIFLLSWLYQPTTQPEALTVASAAGQNHSLNQTAAAPASAVAVVDPPAAETAMPSAAPAASAPAVESPEAAASVPGAATAPGTQPEPAALPSAATSFAPAGRFVVQVNSFNNSSEANERVSKLRASGFAARAAAVEIPRRGTWHRVYVGGFDTREEAARHAGELKAKGVAPAGLVVEVK